MITWTNNSSNQNNLWDKNDQATWTVTDNDDITTGTIPDWIKSGDYDDKPQFYFADARERTMMVNDYDQQNPGDVYRGNGTVDYSSDVLTISETLDLELNNWTVQVTQTTGPGVFRWPGWGAMTVRWADPGCHAWDLNEGDQTHLIMRTVELSGADGFDTVDELDQTVAGEYQVTYQLGATSMTRQVQVLDTDPCARFTVTRVIDSAGNSVLNITTVTPDTRVWIQETTDSTLDIRGVVRPIADDEYDYLFIASGEGVAGSGRLIFDGGFPKYYNEHWDDAYLTDLYHEDVPGQFPFLANCIEYSTTRDQNTRTNRVCYLNDRDRNQYYGVYPLGAPDSNISEDGFQHSLNGVCEATGRTMSYFQDVDGSTIDPDTGETSTTVFNGNGHRDWIEASTWTADQYQSYFEQFDVVLWFGTAVADWLNTLGGTDSAVIQGLLQAYDTGTGVICVTDHDDFQSVINHLVAAWGVTFSGDLNRTSTADEYLVSTMLANTDYIPGGTHVLFDNIPLTSRIYAGESEGVVNRTTTGLELQNFTSDENGELVVSTNSSGESWFGSGELYITTANGCSMRLPVYEPPDTNRRSSPPATTIADRLNSIPSGTTASGEVVMVGPFAAVNETTYTKSSDGDWWDVTGFNTGVNRVEFRDNNGTTQVSYTGPNLGPTEGGWYDVSFQQRPGFGSNSNLTVVMESRYMPDHDAAWYSSTEIDAAISGQ